MGNENIYSVGKESGKTFFSFRQIENFAGISRDGLSCKVLVNLTAWHDSSASSHMLHIWPFAGCSTREFLTS